MSTIFDRLAALESRAEHQRPHLWVMDDGDRHDGPPVSRLITCPNQFRLRYGHCRPGESLAEFLARADFDTTGYEVHHIPINHGFQEKAL